MDKFTVILPMAGSGKRFRDAGFNTPKPFIKVGDKTVAQWALSCLPWDLIKNVVVVTNDYMDVNKYCVVPYDNLGKLYAPCDLVVEPKQSGQATSVLFALEYYQINGPVIVLNCDQVFSCNEQARVVFGEVLLRQKEALVLTFDGLALNDKDYSKWSFVFPHRTFISPQIVSTTSEVDGIVEKPGYPVPDAMPILGVFAFNSAANLASAIRREVALHRVINGEYYLAPALNHMIYRGLTFGSGVHWCSVTGGGIGTPEDLDEFCKLSNVDWRGQNK